MPVDLIVLCGALAMLAVFVGVAVKGLLDASSRSHAADDIKYYITEGET